MLNDVSHREKTISVSYAQSFKVCWFYEKTNFSWSPSCWVQISLFVGIVLGTPSEDNWPGVSQLPDFHKISFTETRQLSFKQILPDVDDGSRTMLERFLRYYPESRITAKQVYQFGYIFQSNILDDIIDASS